MPHNRSCSLSLLMSPPMLIFALSFILFTLSNLNKTWDSFNIIFFVLFVIFFGVFFRKNDDVSCTPYQQHALTASVVAPSDDAYVNLGLTREEKYVSHQWFDFSSYELEEGDNTYHTHPITQLQSPATGDSRSRRSTSFHHGLSSQSPCGTGADRNKFRCSEIPVNHRTRQRGDEKEDNFKEIPAEKFETRSSKPPRIKSPPPPPTPPPSPPQQPAVEVPENKYGKNEKRKRSMKKEIATAWASLLSNQKKRKKKSYSIFRSLFKKGVCKGNKVHSVLAPIPLQLMPATITTGQIPLSPVPPSPAPPLKLAETECPPMEDADVDDKATTFIAKLKNEWKLEKLKSMKERLECKFQDFPGPGPGPLRDYDL